MNYRHIYHAGNLCDVVKHAILTLLIGYMQQKDKGFAVLDTHAGCGRYDLRDPLAEKTGEALGGIVKLWDSAEKPPLLDSYFQVLRQQNKGEALQIYPGSPLFTRTLLRKQDRLIACELHPEDYRKLRHLFFEDGQAQVHHRDGYEALKAFLPFPEKRGIVFIDPPFEVVDEYDRLVQAVHFIHERAPQTVIAIWYPIKDRPAIWKFHEALIQTAIPQIMAAEFLFHPEARADKLNGTGQIIINPPWTLGEQLTTLLPALQKTLEIEDGSFTVRELAL